MQCDNLCNGKMCFTELESQGKLHTGVVTFDLVQRMTVSLLESPGEGHKKRGIAGSLMPSAYFSAHWPSLQLLIA